MDTNDNLVEDYPSMHTAKTVTGVRTSPELKMELTNEAINRGMSISEYGELLFYNRNKETEETVQLRKNLAALQQENEKLKTLVTQNDSKQLEAVLEENKLIRITIEEQSRQLALFNDKRLLYIFQHLKGKKDIVENAYGDNFEITYETPVDVILASIYSTKLNK